MKRFTLLAVWSVVAVGCDSRGGNPPASLPGSPPASVLSQSGAPLASPPRASATAGRDAAGARSAAPSVAPSFERRRAGKPTPYVAVDGGRAREWWPYDPMYRIRGLRGLDEVFVIPTYPAPAKDASLSVIYEPASARWENLAKQSEIQDAGGVFFTHLRTDAFELKSGGKLVQFGGVTANILEYYKDRPNGADPIWQKRANVDHRSIRWQEPVDSTTVVFFTVETSSKVYSTEQAIAMGRGLTRMTAP